MKREIENSLRRAVDALPRADFGTIAAAQATPMREHDHMTRQKRSRPALRRGLVALAAACLLIAVAVGGWVWQFRVPVSVIDLDINPSFEITLNRGGQVLALRALSEEAEGVLDGRNYRGWELDEAAESLFFELMLQGYLDGDDAVMLLSVSGRSEAEAAELTQRLADRLALTAMQGGQNPGIVAQRLDEDGQLAIRAAEYGISAGKMQLVDRLLGMDQPHSEAALARMRVAELLALAEQYGVTGTEVIHYPGLAGERPASRPDSTTPSAPPASSKPPPPASSKPPASSQSGDSPYDDSPYDDSSDSPYSDSPYSSSAPSSGDSPYDGGNDDSPYDGGGDDDNDSPYDDDD